MTGTCRNCGGGIEPCPWPDCQLQDWAPHVHTATHSHYCTDGAVDGGNAIAEVTGA